MIPEGYQQSISLTSSVMLGLKLRKLFYVDSETGVVRLSALVNMYWYDPRLSFRFWLGHLWEPAFGAFCGESGDRGRNTETRSPIRWSQCLLGGL